MMLHQQRRHLDLGQQHGCLEDKAMKREFYAALRPEGVDSTILNKHGNTVWSQNNSQDNQRCMKMGQSEEHIAQRTLRLRIWSHNSLKIIYSSFPKLLL